MPDNRTVVLVEEDYKGEYARFALTPHGFYRRYPFAPEATVEGDAYTLRPMVHIWYRSATIGDDVWNAFFTDMSWGLPEGDINDGNLAFIDWGNIDPDYLDDVALTRLPRRIAPDVAAEYWGIEPLIGAIPIGYADTNLENRTPKGDLTMQLKDLSPVLRSSRGGVQLAVVYDIGEDKDLCDGASVDYAVQHYGEYVLDRISAYGHYLVLHVRKEA